MSDKITESPQIRFAGFTDAWEQCKLGDYIIPYNKVTTQNNQYPVFTSSRKGLFFQKDYYDGNQIASEDNTGYNIVPRGYFTYRHMSDDLVFKFNINNLAENGIVSTLYPVFTTTESLDSKYLQYQLNEGEEFKRFAILQKQGGSRTYMYLSKLEIMTLTMPKIDEQIKIGNFFKQLDDTISLHQRTLELLKDMKKSLLQQMFPKDGANVPEIRFAGYTNAWEPRRLGEYANFRRGSFPQPYGNKEWYDGDGAMPFVQVIDVTEHLVLVDDTKQKISKLAQPKSVFVPKGKVLVTLQGSIGRVAITQYDCFVDRTLLIFEGYEKPTDEHFWAYIIQKKFEIERNKAPGGTIKTITKEALSSFEVLLPKYKEQKQIGTFFNQLDNLITLHQRELNLLKDLKKSLLQQMFI
ncbi:restriction endonuclease subunit S [Bacillus pumilus]|nr:restriction endonuclease subunit S [Bacillus pumilus]WOP23471.1 restriction endonuclease subunit S [Bacillus pumilus]